MARKKRGGKKKSSRRGRKRMSGIGKGINDITMGLLGGSSANTVALIASKKITGVNPYFIAGGEAVVGGGLMFYTKHPFLQAFGAMLLYNGILTALAQTGILSGIGATYKIPFAKNGVGAMKEMNILTGTGSKVGQSQPAWRGVLSGLGMA